MAEAKTDPSPTTAEKVAFIGALITGAVAAIAGLIFLITASNGYWAPPSIYSCYGGLVSVFPLFGVSGCPDKWSTGLLLHAITIGGGLALLVPGLLLLIVYAMNMKNFPNLWWARRGLEVTTLIVTLILIVSGLTMVPGVVVDAVSCRFPALMRTADWCVASAPTLFDVIGAWAGFWDWLYVTWVIRILFGLLIIAIRIGFIVVFVAVGIALGQAILAPKVTRPAFRRLRQEARATMTDARAAMARVSEQQPFMAQPVEAPVAAPAAPATQTPGGGTLRALPARWRMPGTRATISAAAHRD